MNQHLHSPTKLTEFARDFEDEEPNSLFGRFVNKIQNAYNQSYNTVNELPSSTQVAVSKSVFYADPKGEAAAGKTHVTQRAASEGGMSVPKTHERAGSDPSSSSSTTTTNAEDSSEVGDRLEELPIEANEGRTMLSVLKRISNILASKNSDLRDYKDTDLQRLWMPDSKAKECFDCAQKFSTFRRKHHCRLCGQIFCSKCCNQAVPGRIIMCSGYLKVCNYCSKIVLNYLKSPNIAVDLHSDLQALQQDLSNKLEDKDSSSKMDTMPRPVPERKISVGYQEERFATHQPSGLSVDDRKNILQQSNSLITLQEEMRRVLPLQNCGTDLIEFLNANHKSSNKVQAIAILSAMLAAGFLQPIVPDSELTDFDENLHYKLVDLPRRPTLDTLSYKNLSKISVETSDEPQPPKSIDASFSFQSVHELEMDNSMRSTATTNKLVESYCDHEEQLLTQMLRSYNLDLRWAKVLMPLCCRAANDFKPEYCSNDLMDIRNYVNFKKVPGGKRQECTIVGGVVFSKNVAHKDMATRVELPRILLLQCPIVYERIEGKFVSIATVLLQEEQYLRNVCERIMSFRPNVVLVHKNVAGMAQDMLRSHGITLVLDVKQSVMERLARSLQCDILTSIESNIAQPKLGMCDAFYIRNFSDGSGTSKTLMFFEKLTNPRGFTCLLRGGNNKELSKVKKVASFLVYARYNWLLEMSFLLDEFAQPLTPKPPIFDSKESSPKSEQITTDEPQLRSPTQKRVPERKPEEKVLAAVTENVADFTDPLRSTDLNNSKQSSDNSSIVELAVETRYDNRFRNALSSTILSVSPFLTFPLPYLETEQGRKCALRKLFPPELYFSKQWSSCANFNNNNNNNSENVEPKQSTDSITQDLNPPHPFLKLKITTPIDNREIQTLLAEFRACGGRYPKKKKMFKLLKRRESYQKPQKISEDHVYKDALDLENHQRLPVLFCSFYFNPKAASSFCAPPTLLDMKFYGQQDIMLWQFLQRYCCRLSTICTVCNLPMLGHVRRYVHSMGCVQVFLSEDNTKEDVNRIYFTAWCSICNEMTPSVPLSETSKCLSFAKYLELRFHGHAYKKRPIDVSVSSPNSSASLSELEIDKSTKCQHSLHRDYVHYFSYRGVGAKFQYTPVEVWEIGLPPLILTLLPPKPFDRFHVLEELKNFSLKGHEVYTRIHERIADLALDDDGSPLVSNLKVALNKDQFIFKQQLEIVQTLLTMSEANTHDISDATLMAKRVLAESIELWGPRLHGAAKLASKQQQQQQQLEVAQHADAGTICTEELRPGEHGDSTPTAPDAPRVLPSPSGGDNLSQTESTNEMAICSDTPTSTHTFVEKKSSMDQLLHGTPSSTSSDKKSIKKMLIQLLPSTEPVNLLQSPFTPQEHYTLPLGVFPVPVHDQDLSSIIAYTLTSHEYERLLANLDKTTSTVAPSTDTTNNNGSNVTSAVQPSPNLKRKSQDGAHEGDLHDNRENTPSNKSIPGHNNNNNVNSGSADGIGGNEDERNRTKSQHSHIELNFQDASAHFTCKVYFAKEFDEMRAKTLRTPRLNKSLYKDLELNKKREELKVSQSRSGPEIELVRKTSDAGIGSSSADGNDTGTANNNNNNNSSDYKDDKGVNDCRHFLARSLCKSVQWEARGGKSGSRFCKTLDDRFVLKEMTKQDISIFENFAPNYFDYIDKCQQQNQPTLLTKIFGVFRVIVKKKDSVQEKTLLVMENLFYDCDIKNKFDLKGSERNRLVDPTNQQGEIVLLDENLVQMSWSKPLYILSHSKAVLKDAINRDSSFLEKNQVMDYSLLVGLDNKNGLLVLGIIDYIRTFTFDKRVESFVKQTGILGGMGKLPTVISPERYKQRFIDAMDRYFYTVPDRWEGLSKI